ncbi:hypothetical protein [Siphonobacter sp. SORGH_AS_0500]|uniref:hypothetical protein n=1 Tax=Siphonobacter sp. SORGH_AS_0500 TaxID=1864824 RepID=UPI002855E3D0|nr:hypothetical protein [Siphonobacter sp. SORGH_AS_0500]MDR6194717.1 hypothetical protein [Siphonobacter sp. SORGH_AS_0500]
MEKLGNTRFNFERSAEVTITGEQFDDNTGVKGKGGSTVTIAKKTYDVYKWGSNNKLPNEMIALLRSNGDIANLIDTSIDFFFGAGVGVFQHTVDSTGTLIMTPKDDWETREKLIEAEIPTLVDAFGTSIWETANAFINVSNDTKGTIKRKVKVLDPLTVRCEKVKEGSKKKIFLTSADWTGWNKNANAVPAFDYSNPNAQVESILQCHRFQSGQFYYGYARWWAAADWIKLANRIPKTHNNSLDTESNLGYIVRIANDYFDTMFRIENILDDEEAQAKYRDAFYAMCDTLLHGGDGKLRIIYDEVPMGIDGKLQEYIRFDAIPRLMTGKEYTELYSAAVMAFANAGGILSSLAGVSDGKMMGGSGSELRVAAEYQQFYRTPRSRQMLLDVLNRIMRKPLGLKDNEFFGFNNILLETLDKSPTGSRTVKSNNA